MAITDFSKIDDQQLHLPRILCLHGGGTNARIFRAQCRAIKAELKSRFRLCFAEAPFPSKPGPDVVSVYKEYGPFRSWLRSGSEHPRVEPQSTIPAIQNSLRGAMKEDDQKGADGEWVGLLGFSQGAKMCASLLFNQQVRAEKLGEQQAGSHYRFAVLLAGRGPLVSLDPALAVDPTLVDTSQVAQSDQPNQRSVEVDEHALHLPTIHVHGMQDPGLDFHKQLLDNYCEDNARVTEWEGNHRVPIKTKDVAAVVQQIDQVAKEEGVLESVDGDSRRCRYVCSSI